MRVYDEVYTVMQEIYQADDPDFSKLTDLQLEMNRWLEDGS